MPDVRFYREIPFVDAPEGVYLNILSHKRGTIGPVEWADKRPYLLMIDPDGAEAIEKFMLEQCRYAGPECNVKLRSVADVIRALDDLARAILEKN